MITNVIISNAHNRYAVSLSNPVQSNAIPIRPLAPRPVSLSLPPVHLSVYLSFRPSMPLDPLAKRPQNAKTPGPCRDYCGFHLISFQISQTYQARTQGL